LSKEKNRDRIYPLHSFQQIYGGFMILKHRLSLVIFMFLVILLLSSCSQAATPAQPATPVEVEVTRVVEKTVIVTQVVEKIITATPLPTTPSASSEESETVEAASQPTTNSAGIDAWCLKTRPVVGEPPSFQMPEKAIPAKFTDVGLTLTTETASCTIVYTFDRAASEGMVLKVYDTRKDPWINASLTISPENPNQAAVVLVHPYVVNPPFWSVDYRFSLCDAQGNEIRSDKITMKRGWIPKQCFDGSYPDPVTLMCPPLPEAHPWDPWYGFEQPYGKKDCTNEKCN
jgi:hypothetical protein